MKKKSFLLALTFIIAIILVMANSRTNKLPVVAIASYGPHASLVATIEGLKEQMFKEGFIEGKNISFIVADVGFDQALIPQMISSLKAKEPKIMVAMTTPVAQFAKGKIHDIPLVYSVITDPVDAGLIKEQNLADKNITGSSDKQDLESLIKFAKSLLPEAKRIGLLYAISDSNDISLLNMMRKSAASLGMEVVSVPVEQARDVPLRMQEFKDKVDFIYIGTSGPIQPTLPAIAAEASKLNIPVFNAEAQAVRDGLALASFGVDYLAIGRNTGKLVVSLLNGMEVGKLSPNYPTATDHFGIINKKLAKEFGIKIPQNIEVAE